MSPRIVGANLVVSIKTFSREKSAVFFTIAFPIILILVFGTIFLDQDAMSFALHVQDLDETKSSAQLVQMLEQSGRFRITKVAPAVDAVRYAKDNRLNLVLVIPKGYDSALVRRMTFRDPTASVAFTYIYDSSSTTTAAKMQALQSVFGAVSQGLSGSLPFIGSVETSVHTKTYRFIEFFVPGIIAMSVMTASLSGAVNVNAQLRQKGVIRKLSTTPITRTEWILSNILYQMILAAMSTIAILLVSYAVFGVSLRIDAWLPAFIALEVFAFAGMGMILTRVATEAESAVAAANVIMFPMMFLSGSFFPLEMMPGFLQTFARVLPLYYVNEGLRASMVFADTMTALRCSAVIGAFAAAVFILGTLSTRWEEGT
ncbi:MAG: ABC transporter permease [Zetaproteobacteria bacterium]|nr:MAG: ABC transporter permease [Zetaproteobacteria bacterium]